MNPVHIPTLLLAPPPPIVMVDGLKLLLHIWEDPGSNLVPDTSHPRLFVVFLSPSTQVLGQYLKIRPLPLVFKSSPIHNSLIIPSFNDI
jgi:hypothetical protein